MSQLTHEQRYTISVLKKENHSQSDIAKIIGKDKSVVCRELKRNCDKRNQHYNAELAQRKCDDRHEQKSKKKTFTPEIIVVVEHLLAEKYSPEQIAGVLKKDQNIRISHERIYQLFGQTKRLKVVYINT